MPDIAGWTKWRNCHVQDQERLEQMHSKYLPKFKQFMHCTSGAPIHLTNLQVINRLEEYIFI